MDLDEFEEQLGTFSFYKIFILVSCIFAIFAGSWTPFTSVYYNAVPDHRCRLPYFEDNTTCVNKSEENFTSLAIPPGDSCHRYIYNSTDCLISGNLSCLTNASANGIVRCDNGFHYDDSYFEETVATEWNLLCDRSLLNSFVTSLLFVGIFFGSPPAGYVVDWFGRKTALLVLSVGLMASGLGCTYAPTLAVYCVFRFIEGSTCVPLAGAIFSYANEVAGRSLRSTVGTIIMFSTSISHTILPAVAYVLRDWRDLNLASALLPLAFIITWPFIPETPKWLLMKGKEEEARKVLNRYAKSRGKTLNEDDWQIVLDTEKKKMESISTRSHLTDLFRRPFTRIVSLVVLFDWFAVNCVFYGLVLNAGSLSGDPYVNGVLNGATEIIAVIVYGAVNKKYGAKVCIILGMLCSGSLCLVAMIAGEIDSTSETALQVVRWVSITGKLFATVSFYATYQYTNDVFPVITRGKAMALASSFARVGSIIIPFILEVQSDSIWVTQAILGFLGLSAGLATLIMPQTSSKVATTTLQEAEKGYRVNMKWIAKFIKYKRTTNENADERKVQIEYLDVETNNNNTIFTNHVTKL